MTTTNALLLAVAAFVVGAGIGFYLGRTHPPNPFITEQLQAEKAGVRWAQYKLWDAYYHGTHGVDKNLAEADKWLGQFVKNVYVVRFEPANGFKPGNASDYLRNIEKHTPDVHSDNNGIGVAGFFRTRKVGDKLVASFLSNEPGQLRGYIEENPDHKFISVEPITLQSFIEYHQSAQESL